MKYSPILVSWVGHRILTGMTDANLKNTKKIYSVLKWRLDTSRIGVWKNQIDLNRGVLRT